MHTAKRRGFTLIELIIAIVIIAILASMAAPAIMSMRAKAACSEAVGIMGFIRAALRNYYVEYGSYPASEESFLSDDELKIMGINSDDLNGVYFSKECYYYENSGEGFRILCYPGSSTAPKAEELMNLLAQDFSGGGVFDRPSSAFATTIALGYLVMYHTGKIAQSGIPKSGYPEDDGTP